jgi:nitroreductase
MDKPAPTAHPVHELIAKRWSPRAFEDRPVERDRLLSLLEAARWSPSSYNGQPWHFIIATRDDKAEYDRLLGCLVEFNQNWAKAAPVLMLAVAARKFEHDGKPNRHATHDVGMALQNLALQATAMGLAVHFMAGFDIAKARQTYSIGEDYDPITAAAIGYGGDPASLSSDMHDREMAPRKRKPISDFVYTGKFGKRSSLVQ